MAELLTVGIYEIPEGCTVVRAAGGRSIEVRPFRDKRVKQTDKRCKNCIFYADGHSMKSQWYRSKVCIKRPKQIKGLFYATTPYGGKDCDIFQSGK